MSIEKMTPEEITEAEKIKQEIEEELRQRLEAEELKARIEEELRQRMEQD